MQNSDTPKVSLLVPICNVERYLRECLDSAVAQTLEDIEIICINDGSTDSSPDIIREYMERDPRVKMIDKINSGYGDSMNRGLEMARGKYVGILESDDFMAPDALEKLVGAVERYDADFAKANFDLYWSNPEERRELMELFKVKECNKPVHPSDTVNAFSLKPSIWSAVYRRRLAQRFRMPRLPLRYSPLPIPRFTCMIPCFHIARITRALRSIRLIKFIALTTSMPRFIAGLLRIMPRRTLRRTLPSCLSLQISLNTIRICGATFA